ncbi:MAG: hypothetical protein U1E10_14340, partial [Bdellovibrionales bacterium]|nr:hypothetical protein [Bdellovibrionales bacterium]
SEDRPINPAAILNDGQFLVNLLRDLLLSFLRHWCDEIYLLPNFSVKNVGEEAMTVSASLNMKMKNTFRFVIKAAVRLFL